MNGIGNASNYTDGEWDPTGSLVTEDRNPFAYTRTQSSECQKAESLPKAPKKHYSVIVWIEDDTIYVRSDWDQNLIDAMLMIPSRTWDSNSQTTRFHISDKAKVYAAMVLTISGRLGLGPNGEFVIGGKK